MSKVTEECLRRFDKIEADAKDREERLRALEKFQVATLAIVGVANFIWFFFVYPWIDRIIKLGR